MVGEPTSCCVMSFGDARYRSLDAVVGTDGTDCMKPKCVLVVEPLGKMTGLSDPSLWFVAPLSRRTGPSAPRITTGVI